MTKMNLSKETMGGIERFMMEQEAAKQLTPEMEAAREKSLELLKTRAKKNSLTEILTGFEAMEDEDSDAIQGLLDKTKEKEEVLDEELKSTVKELVQGDHVADFVNVAKRTRFATAMKPLEAHSFASRADEVITRIDEKTNEQILLTDPEFFADMLEDETNENIKRFVGMYRQRAVSKGIGAWLEENISDDVQKRRAVEHLEEMKGKPQFEHTIKTLIGRWLNISDFLKDKNKTDDEKKEFYQKTLDELMVEFKSEYTIF